MYSKFVLCFLALLMASTLWADVAEARTNLRLPRFVTVKSSEANVRSGPGLRYRIEWVMVRADMPVEVIAEYEQWRKIKDIQGDEGWIHRSMLSNRRTAVVINETQVLREGSSPNSMPVARAEVGVNAKVLSCNKVFCKIFAAGHKGWVDRKNLWGLYPGEMN